MISEPPRLAQRTREVTGASGYWVIASTPRRARVPRRAKKVNQARVYSSVSQAGGFFAVADCSDSGFEGSGD